MLLIGTLVIELNFLNILDVLSKLNIAGPIILLRSGLLARQREFFFLMLREPFRFFLDKQFSLLPGLRLRVHFWKDIAIPLNKKGRHSSEWNIRLQSLEHCVIGEV